MGSLLGGSSLRSDSARTRSSIGSLRDASIRFVTGSTRWAIDPCRGRGEAEYLELHDRLSLWDLFERYPGRRGVRKAKVALEALKDEPLDQRKSRLEERFAPFLRRHNLPRARFNQWILVGDKRFQVDCLWPDQRQIVELDGWAGHKTRTAFREDRARDRKLRVAGYGVTRLTWNQLEDEPTVIASDLGVLLEIDRQREEESRLRRPGPKAPCNPGSAKKPR